MGPFIRLNKIDDDTDLNKLLEIAKSSKSTLSYKKMTDIDLFVFDTEMVFGGTKVIPTKEIYIIYQIWCRDTNKNALNKDTFSKQFAKIFHSERTEFVRGYYLKIKPDILKYVSEEYEKKIKKKSNKTP